MHPTCNILVGDCLERLRQLPANHFQCTVTSPPYYGLRDYGLQPTEWPEVTFSPMPGLPQMTIPAMNCCLGLELDPWSFIGHMVAVFREVGRTLRDDGTLWLNMGDSYCCNPGGGQGGGGQMVGRSIAAARDAALDEPTTQRPVLLRGLKAKDVMGMPWRLFFALQADGWWGRQDLIWNKPNPMPESVHDRCCKSHEYVFLLSKRPRYYYDTEAVKEPVTGTAKPRGNGVNAKIKAPQGWAHGKGSHGTVHPTGRTNGTVRPKQNESSSSAVSGLVGNRHRRSVWTITTEAFRGAHFATFPSALVRPCILAGTSERGCCPTCRAPYARIVKKGAPNREHQKACGGDENGEYHGEATKDYAAAGAEDPSAVKARILRGMVEHQTVGWKATCKCAEATPVPCEVLDPFGGSGTTGAVALQLGRSATLIELNPEYAALANQRTAITPALSGLTI